MTQSDVKLRYRVVLMTIGLAMLEGGRMIPSPALAEPAALTARVVKLDFTMDGGSGGLIAADVNGDGRKDFVVTSTGRFAAYTQDGKRLWLVEDDIRVSAGSSENAGLPGHHAPGIQVADVDGDGNADLLYLDQSSTVHILNAATGRHKRSVRVPHPDGAERWEHLVVCNLRGKGDRDLIVQATNAKGYRVGHYVAAYAIEKLDGEPLWQNDRFGALAHGPLRVADLTGDGRDEVCGFTILSPEGKPTSWQYPAISPEYGKGRSFHIDALIIDDVRPDVPGLEVVLLEEGRNHTGVVNFEHGLLWWSAQRDWEEPQNGAVGQFDPDRPGLEVWCRSRHNRNQVPYVFDAQGNIIAEYELSKTAPEGWSAGGIESIVAIHWTGEEAQLIAAKERGRRDSDVCIIEPLSGRFVLHIREQADRLYVADVSGDWREEIIVINGDELRIYENPAPNPRPDQPRLWEQQHYRRNKMTWNYYSP